MEVKRDGMGKTHTDHIQMLVDMLNVGLYAVEAVQASPLDSYGYLVCGSAVTSITTLRNSLRLRLTPPATSLETDISPIQGG